MFTFDVEIKYLGQFVDEIRVSADNALRACEYVETISRPHVSNWLGHELVARRVISPGAHYTNYFNAAVTA